MTDNSALMFGTSTPQTHEFVGVKAMEYPTLREANEARQRLWDPKNQIDWDWRCNELAGEAGEVCNVLKKIHREILGIAGTRAARSDLADELADVTICADLCAMHLGLPTPNDNRNVIWGGALPRLGAELADRVGDVCHKYEPDYSRKRLAGHLNRVWAVVRHIAKAQRIDLDAAIATKFNATSAKVGLPVTLRLTAN